MDCSQHYKRSACRSVDYHSRVLAFKTELPPASDKLIRANIEEADSVFAGEISLFPELRNANKPIQEVEEIVFGAVYARESEILGSILLEWARVSTKRDVLRAEMMNCTLAFSYASTASATVEAGIGMGINGLDARWQTCEHAFQMPRDLGAGRPIAIAQLARDVLLGLGHAALRGCGGSMPPRGTAFERCGGCGHGDGGEGIIGDRNAADPARAIVIGYFAGAESTSGH